MKAITYVEQGKFAHRYKLDDIEEAYHIFGNKLDGGIRAAATISQ